MRYEISHRTTYDYNSEVSVSHHLLRLKPREHPRQQTLKYHLTTQPGSARQDSHTDYFGNNVSIVVLEGPHRQLTVAAECQVDVQPPAVLEPGATQPWESIADLCRAQSYGVWGEASEFCFPSPLVPVRPEFRDYAAPAFAPGRAVLAAAIELMSSLHKDFAFDTQATTVATPLDQVYRQRRGVCQDFAHLQIACFRAMGLSARYVSGYLETAPPPGQVKLIGADASHAWVQLWCGETGWIDLDPTNNLLPADRHITLAWGRDFGDVSPLRGVLVGSGTHQLTVAVDVNQATDAGPAGDPPGQLSGVST